MRVYRIPAVTLKVKEMEKSCKFFSRIPGFRMVYGSGAPSDTFATFEVGGDKEAYLNLELAIDDGVNNLAPGQNSDYRNISQGHDHNEPSTLGKARAAEGRGSEDFGRIIFHTENVVELYSYMKKDEFISRYAVFETEPADASWGGGEILPYPRT